MGADIDLTGASIRNDFGKYGRIVIQADGGNGAITISDAVLIENDGDIAQLNGRATLPHTGFAHVVGVPETDG
jgi:hypothetical protein